MAGGYWTGQCGFTDTRYIITQVNIWITMVIRTWEELGNAKGET